MPGFTDIARVPTKEFGAERIEGQSTGSAISLAGKLLLSPDPYAQADIVLKNIPGAKLDFDESMRPIIDVGGNRTYMNKPGASPRDFIDFAAAVLKYIPAAKVGGAMTTLPRKILGTGGASLVTSVLEDVSADAAGSEQGIDHVRAGISGLAGGLAEGFIPAAGWALQKVAASKVGTISIETVKNLRKSLELGGYISENGFTAEGIALLRAVGVEAKDISQKLAIAFQKQADDAVTPEASLGAAEAESFGVPITRGEATGDFAQRAEEEILDQVLTEKQSLRPFRETQQQPALIGQEGDTGLGQLQAEVGSPQSATTPVTALDAIEPTPQGSMAARTEQGGQAIGDALAADARMLAGQRDKAFARVDKRVSLKSTETALEGVRRVRRSVRNREDGMELHKVQTPTAWKVDQALNKMMRDLRKTMRTGGDIKPITLRRIEVERQRLNRQIDHASTSYNKQKFPQDQPLLLSMKREMDLWLDDAVRGALFNGDQGALSALKKARSLHAEYMTKYGNREGAGKVLSELAEGNAAPMEVANMLTGLGNLGAKKTSLEVIKRLETIFGKDSAEMGIVREMAFLQIAKKSVSGGRFSADRFVSAYDAVFTGAGRDVAKRLFRPEDLKRMAEFRSLAGRLQKPAGMRASSGTGERLGRMVESGIKKILPLIGFSTGDPATAMTFAAFVTVAEKRAAKKALDWEAVTKLPTTKPAPSVLPKAAAAATGGVIRDDREQ